MNEPPLATNSAARSLIHVLYCCLSAESIIRVPAEKQLSDWENSQTNEYLEDLLNVVRNSEVSVDVRLSAVVCVKNTISRHWKARIQFSPNPKANTLRAPIPNSTHVSSPQSQQQLLHVQQVERISEQQKKIIRQNLLNSVINEQNTKITVQLCVIIAIIARLDYPKNWNELIPNLVSFINNNTTRIANVPITELIAHNSNFSIISTNATQEQEDYTSALNAIARGLLVIHHVVKALASRRVTDHRQQFAQLAFDLFGFLCSHWIRGMDVLFHLLQFMTLDAVPPSVANLFIVATDLSKLSIKTLRRVIVFGIQDYDKLEGVLKFIELIHQNVESLINNTIPNNSRNFNLLQSNMMNVILLHLKLITEMQKVQPLGFIQFLGTWLQFFSKQLLSLASISPMTVTVQSDERFCVQCMVFLRNVLNTDQYQTSSELSLEQDIRIIGGKTVTQFFHQEVVVNICRVLIMYIFPLTQFELQEWQENPEEFLNEEQIDADADKKKPCSERLFLTFLDKFRDWLAPLIVKLLQKIIDDSFVAEERGKHENQQEIMAQSILLREGCYRAIGISAFQLYDYIDFSSWFNNQLIKQLNLSQSMPIYKVIERRIAWLIGCWVIKIPKEMRRNIYAILLNIIHNNINKSSSDLVIALTSAFALKYLIDDVDFSAESFLEFLDPSITLLFQLLCEVSESESKLRVLDVIGVFITQLSYHLYKYIPNIINQLQLIWNNTNSAGSGESTHNNLLKQAVISILTKIIQDSIGGFGRSSTSSLVNVNSNASVKELFAKVLESCVPLLLHSLDITHSDSVYLMDDALHLLFAATSESGVEDIRILFPVYSCVVKMVESGNYEHIKVIFKISENYILLGKQNFLKNYITSFQTLVQFTLGYAKDEACLSCVKTIDVLVQLFPQQAPPSMLPELSLLLRLVLSPASSSQEENQDGKNDWIIVQYIGIFMRILLQNPQFFFSFFQSQSTLTTFLEISLEKFDSISQTKVRKLYALACCNLLPTTQAHLLLYLPQIVNLCLSGVHSEIDQLQKKSQSTKDSSTEIIVEDEEEYCAGMGAANVERQQLSSKDPVNSLQVGVYLMQKLNECSSLNGHTFQQVIQTLHPSILQQLQELKTITL